MAYRIVAVLILMLSAALTASADPVRCPGFLGIDVDSLSESSRDGSAERFAGELLHHEESTHGANSLRTAEAIDLLVRILVQHSRGTETKTIDLAKRAIEIKANTVGTADPGYALSVVHLGRALEKAALYDDALLHLERGKSIFEEIGATHDLRYAYAMIKLGRFVRLHGDMARSRDLYEQCVDLYLDIAGEEYSWTTEAMWGYAIVQRKLGEFDGAIRTLRHAIEIRKQIHGNDSIEVTGLEASLAHVLRQTGDWVEAHRLYDHVLAVEEKEFGPDNRLLHVVLNGLGNLHFEMGDMAESKYYYSRAIEVCRNGYGPEHPHTLASEHNLAGAHWGLMEYEEAKDIYEKVLEFQLRTLGPDHPDVANLHNNLGGLYRSTKDYESAEPHLLRGLELYQKIHGETHPLVAMPLDELGHMMLGTGEYDRGREYFRRALEIREGAFGKIHPDVAHTHYGLTLLETACGDTARAVDAAIRSVSTLRRYRRSVSSGMAESEALAHAGLSLRGIGHAVSLAAASKDPRTVQRVWDEIIRSRAFVFDEMARRHRIQVQVTDPDVRAGRDSLAAASEHLAALMVRGPEGSSGEEFRLAVEAARRTKSKWERKLAEISSEFREEMNHQQCGFDEVIRGVGREEAVVAYVLNTFRIDHDGFAIDPEPAEYVAFVLPAGGGDATAIPIGEATTVDSILLHWRDMVRHGEEGHRQAGEQLRRLIWDPVTVATGNAATIQIVPDGTIHLVDFLALPAADGKYMIESAPHIRFVSAERELREAEDLPRKGEGLLALGGPDYELAGKEPEGSQTHIYRGRPADCGSFESVLFESLPGAMREAKEVVASWESGGRATHLEGSAASEAAFKRSAPGHHTLHLATHAFFLGEACSGKGGNRGIGGAVVAGNESTMQSPLLLSGLALAGANRRAEVDPESSEDGILTAEEIAALDLTGVELAVLSACGTGLGKVRAGEGIFGLRRAFRIAGVRSLLLSLWDVDDETTRDWMRLFYEKLAVSGRDLSGAVRATSLELLRARRATGEDDHPIHWAGFVATGG